MRTRALLCLSIPFLACFCADALAAPLEEVNEPIRTKLSAPNDAAVVVSVEDYFLLGENLSVPYAHRDGDGIRNFLLYTKGIPPKNLTRIQGREATREKIGKAFDEALNRAKGGTIWFYFAGHGVAAPKDAGQLLLGSDAPLDEDRIAARSVALNDLMARVTRSKVQNAVFIIDACNAPLGGRFVLPVVLSLSPGKNQNLVVWTAVKHGEKSAPLVEAKHGAFTYAVLSALRGKADGELDGERDLAVTSEEAQAFVERFFAEQEIRKQTPSLQTTAPFTLIDTHGEQIDPEPTADAIDAAKSVAAPPSPSKETARLPESPTPQAKVSSGSPQGAAKQPSLPAQKDQSRSGFAAWAHQKLDLRLTALTAPWSREKDVPGEDHETEHFEQSEAVEVEAGYRATYWGFYLGFSYDHFKLKYGDEHDALEASTDAFGLDLIARGFLPLAKDWTLSFNANLGATYALDTLEDAPSEITSDPAGLYPNRDHMMFRYSLGAELEWAFWDSLYGILKFGAQSLVPFDHKLEIFDYALFLQVGLGVGYRF